MKNEETFQMTVAYVAVRKRDKKIFEHGHCEVSDICFTIKTITNQLNSHEGWLMTYNKTICKRNQDATFITRRKLDQNPKNKEPWLMEAIPKPFFIYDSVSQIISHINYNFF